MAQPIKLGPKTTFIPINQRLQPLPEREAWPIYFDGFEGIDFILFKMDGCWSIHELSTKLRITSGHGSKYEANDKAIYLLGIQGPEKTKLAIKRALKQLGE
jgi:hypothetical protein